MKLDIMYISLSQCFNHMNNVSEMFTEEQIGNYMSTFLYPAGIIPYQSIKFDNSQSSIQILNYLQTQFAYIFKDSYTEEEIEIMCYYYYYLIQRSNPGQNNVFLFIPNFKKLFNSLSEKNEIRYMIEDLKYAVLQRYLIENEEEEEEINQLIEELTPIEEWHNNFNLQQKYL